MTRQDRSCIALQRVLRPLGCACLSGGAMHDLSWHSMSMLNLYDDRHGALVIDFVP